MEIHTCKTCIFKSITSVFTIFVSLKSLLNLLLDNAKISIFTKVDKMYLSLYWVTYEPTLLMQDMNHPHLIGMERH